MKWMRGKFKVGAEPIPKDLIATVHVGSLQARLGASSTELEEAYAMNLAFDEERILRRELASRALRANKDLFSAEAVVARANRL